MSIERLLRVIFENIFLEKNDKMDERYNTYQDKEK